jgi:hypothetical protein
MPSAPSAVIAILRLRAQPGELPGLIAAYERERITELWAGDPEYGGSELWADREDDLLVVVGR